MYGSSMARALYGAGDYQSRTAFAPGYYAAGGFFSGLKKLAGKAVNFANKTVVGKALVGAVPGLGGIVTAAGIAQRGLGAIYDNKPSLSFKGYGGAGPGTGGKLALPAFKKAAAAKAAPSRSRKRRSRKRRAAPARRRRRSSRGRGDYGDDWSGSTPSRAKGTGQFLTRAGGRRHHPEPPRRRRRRRGSRRPGQRVSFTTKDGRHVSFTAR